MIIGLGSDLVDVRRIAKVIERHGERFLARIFTPIERAKAERRANRVETYAKRFAAKEACAKALGTGLRSGVFWRDMGVVNLPSGRPTMQLTGGALQASAGDHAGRLRSAIDVSLTDEGPMAQAIVIISAVPLHGARMTAEKVRNLDQIVIRHVRRVLDCAPWSAATRSPGHAADMRDERPMSVTSGTKRKEGGVGETVRVIIHALIIALVIRTFLFQPFNIPSGSMKATLLVGDYLFVSKYRYGYSHFSLPLSPPLFSGRIPGDWLPAARRRGGVPPAEGHLDRLHQARHRPAGRQDPGDRRPCFTSTARRSSASARRTSSRPKRARATRRSSAGRKRCRTA